MDNLLSKCERTIHKLECKRIKYPNFINLRINKLDNCIHDYMITKKNLIRELKECEDVENKIDYILKKDISRDNLITLYLLSEL